MDTKEPMIALLEGSVIDEYNTKICFIDRIFKQHYYLGTEDSMLKKNKFYFNDMFDLLYSMSNEDLEKVDIHLHGLCIEFARVKIAMQRLKGGAND